MTDMRRYSLYVGTPTADGKFLFLPANQSALPTAPQQQQQHFNPILMPPSIMKFNDVGGPNFGNISNNGMPPMPPPSLINFGAVGGGTGAFNKTPRRSIVTGQSAHQFLLPKTTLPPNQQPQSQSNTEEAVESFVKEQVSYILLFLTDISSSDLDFFLDQTSKRYQKVNIFNGF
jgi:hypothetical protein